MRGFEGHEYVPSQAVRKTTLPPDLNWRYKELPARLSFPGIESTTNMPKSKHDYGVIICERRLTDTELMEYCIRPV